MGIFYNSDSEGRDFLSQKGIKLPHMIHSVENIDQGRDLAAAKRNMNVEFSGQSDRAVASPNILINRLSSGSQKLCVSTVKTS